MHRFTTSEFINKSKTVHGNKYDYSEVVYINRRHKVIIICPLHGEFKQGPSAHLQGDGCPACGYDIIAAKCRSDFLAQAAKINGGKYDYSLVDYRNKHTKVEILCPEHGPFWQKPHNHINSKQGCPICARQFRIPTSDFVSRAVEVHGNKYDYSISNYDGRKSKISITCKHHGIFQQTPNDHLAGKGCRKCASASSKPCIEVAAYIKNIFSGDIEANDRTVIAPYELDIVVPQNKIAVEFNGNYYHSFNRIETAEERTRHASKCNLCLSAGVKLIQINEYEWIFKNQIVKSILAHKLGITNTKYYARKCDIKTLSDYEYRKFISQNHIQGYRSAKITLGLLFNNKIVAAISINKHKSYDYEIIRFANENNSVVVGGFSKLLKHFIRTHHPTTILTYADRRYSDGNVYAVNGFDYIGTTKPNYVYIKSRNYYTRQTFQKHKLAGKLGKFNPSMTEAENMFNNGYRRLWDAGHLKFVLTMHETPSGS